MRLVCENHPTKAWPDECNCGPGMDLRIYVRDELKALADVGSAGDVEYMHGRADELLCMLLRGGGDGEIVDLWDSIPKWYA